MTLPKKSRTLADMTPDKRRQCQGMWCSFPGPGGKTNLAVYIGMSTRHLGFAELIHEGQWGTLTLPENLTPRFDLPRAWTPDGMPVPLQRDTSTPEPDLPKKLSTPLATDPGVSPSSERKQDYAHEWEALLKDVINDASTRPETRDFELMQTYGGIVRGDPVLEEIWDRLTASFAPPPVLDMTCGSRMMWFDKDDDRVIFTDNRAGEHAICDGRTITVAPDVLADFRDLPFPDE